MKNIKNIYIHDNGNNVSSSAAQALKDLFVKEGFYAAPDYSEDIDLLVCIGGDGTFLRMLRQYDFPSMPIVGIHTGHLGFFQEFMPDDIPELVKMLKNGDFSVQEHNLIQSSVRASDGKTSSFRAINDVVIKGLRSTLIHLDMGITDSFLEHFSGDGILFAAPAGSTAYNYSLGGSIVDPRVKLLQITPIAPMNTTVFRSFTSSIMLPPDSEVRVKPDNTFSEGAVIVADGAEYQFERIKDVTISLCSESVKIIRRKDYDFWATVKSKFF